MTKGELIVACLEIMFENDGIDIDPAIVSSDEDYNNQYGSKIVNMVNSINRGLMEVQKNNKVHKSVVIINAYKDEEQVDDGFPKLPLKEYLLEYELPNDVYKVINISYDDGTYLLNNIPIRKRGNKTLLLTLQKYGRYIIEYYPKLPLLTKDMEDTEELDIPDDILQIIPYFVKADLYEEDEPNIAIATRNIFSAYLSEIDRNEETQSKVVSNYKIDW